MADPKPDEQQHASDVDDARTDDDTLRSGDDRKREPEAAYEPLELTQLQESADGDE